MEKINTTFNVVIGLILIALVIVGSYLLSTETQQSFVINSADMLQNILKDDFKTSTTQEMTKGIGNILVDIRSKSEFDKGHIPNAVNIYAASVLKEENIDFFNTLREEKKQALLYGSDIVTVNTTLMILHQMGFKNTRILSKAFNHFDNTKIESTNATISNQSDSNLDIPNFIKNQNKKATERITLEKKKSEENRKALLYKKRIPVRKGIPIVLKKKVTPKSTADEEDEGC